MKFWKDFILGSRKIMILAFLFTILSILSSCVNKSESQVQQDLVNVEKELEKSEETTYPTDTTPEIKYFVKTFKSIKEKNRFLDSVSKLSSISKTILMTLNRKQWNHLLNSKEIIVPDKFTENRLDYSIFPHYYEGAKNLPKLIMVSAHYQALGCYEYGKLVKFAPVNSGKEKTQTYPGRYALTFRQRTRHSSIDSTWIMHYYFNFHPEAGMALHQYNLPGYPASHSCLRMLESDAAWIYDWGEGYKRDSAGKPIRMSGTPLVIIDHYPFGSPKHPWMEIQSNKSVKLNLPADPMQVDEPLIPIVQIPEGSRSVLVNKQRYIIAEDSLRKLGIIRPGVQITPSVNFNKLRWIKKQKEMEQKKREEQLKILQEGQTSGTNQN